MYAYKTRETFTQDINFEARDAEMFYRWRKHPNLHNWMETLYEQKGGIDVFNCQNLRLDIDDLEELEHAIQNEDLPLNYRFFGLSDGSEKSSDLAFVKKAREAIEEGFTVYCTSWW